MCQCGCQNDGGYISGSFLLYWKYALYILHFVSDFGYLQNQACKDCLWLIAQESDTDSIQLLHTQLFNDLLRCAATEDRANNLPPTPDATKMKQLQTLLDGHEHARLMHILLYFSFLFLSSTHLRSNESIAPPPPMFWLVHFRGLYYHVWCHNLFCTPLENTLGELSMTFSSKANCLSYFYQTSFTEMLNCSP